MALEVRLCEDSDIRRVTDVMLDAFGDQVLIHALFPGNNTAAGRDRIAGEFLKKKHTNAHSTFLKCVDTSTDTIIGMATWGAYGRAKPPTQKLSRENYDSDEDYEFSEHLLHEHLKRRLKFLDEAKEPVMILELLAVDPKGQGRGAGTMLVKWGTNIADEEMKAVCILESTVEGKPLYERCGFVAVDEYEFLNNERWGDNPGQKEFFMVRSKKEV